MTLRTAVFMLVAIVLSGTCWVANADEAKANPTPVSVDVGTFSMSGYAAWTASVAHDGVCLYVEKDTKSEYELFIGAYTFDSRGDRAVVRVDDGKFRFGVFSPLYAGFSARVIAGDGPTRLDLWTPSIGVGSLGNAEFSLSGWFRAHTENKPDAWAMANLAVGNFTASYGFNLRRDGGDFVSTNYRAFEF